MPPTAWVLAVALGLFTAGCAPIPPQAPAPPSASHIPEARPNFDNGRFRHVAVPEAVEIFQLSEAQQEAFLAFYGAAHQRDLPGHKRLYAYLERLLAGFDYREDTHTAGEALARQSGNCLSLAILTTALARLAGIEVAYQRVSAAPVYQRYHNVMTLSSHVRTHVFDPDYAPAAGEILLLKPKIVIDYFPQSGNVGGQAVSQADFIAMYYQNLAGDALVSREFDRAFSLLWRALEIAPDNPETLNTLAVLYRQDGDPGQAEAIYRYALENTRGSVNLLSNYALLLEDIGRVDEARRLESRVVGIDDDNPYRWLDAADKKFSRSQYRAALLYFEKAAAVAPYLAEAHFGLARAHYALGAREAARHEMQQAVELAYIPAEQRQYQAKLRILESGSSP